MIKEIFFDLVTMFVQNAMLILIISASLLLLGGLIWLLYRFSSRFRFFVRISFPRLAREAKMWILVNFPVVVSNISAFLRWAGRMIINFFFFLAELVVSIWDAVNDWRTNRRAWALAHAIAEEIRRGELSEATEDIAVAAHSCTNCAGSRRKPRFTLIDATRYLKNLEKELHKGICVGCLSELAGLSSLLNAGTSSSTVVSPVAVASATPVAVTPAVPAAIGTRRGGPEKAGWFNRLLIFAGGVFLAWIGVTALAVSSLGLGWIGIGVGAIFSIAGGFVIKNAIVG